MRKRLSSTFEKQAAWAAVAVLILGLAIGLSWGSDKVKGASPASLGGPQPKAIDLQQGPRIDQDQPGKWAGRKVTALDFTDASHGWAVLDDGTILATSDGGGTWLLVAEGSFEFRDNNFGYYAISMADQEHGCAVGSWVGFIGVVYPRVAFTADGRNWTALELKDFPGFSLSGVCMVNATEGWAVGTAVDESGTPLLLHTIDGGTTWDDRSRTLPKAATGLHSVWFTDPQCGWVVGKAGKVFVTVDGGASWWPQQSGIASDLLSVRFVDRWLGFAAGDEGVLLETTDGGRSWVPVSGELAGPLRALALMERRVWIVDDQGTIWTGQTPDSSVGQRPANALWFFADVGASPYAQAIESLARAGVVDGFKDGTYRPDEPVKRAQLAKMTVRLLGLSRDCGSSLGFLDLGAPDSQGYPHEQVTTLACLGTLDELGVTGRLFGPWEPVRRQQAIALIQRVTGKVFPQWQERYGQSRSDLIAGIEGVAGGWDPNLPISRGELARVLYNLRLLLDSLP